MREPLEGISVNICFAEFEQEAGNPNSIVGFVDIKEEAVSFVVRVEAHLYSILQVRYRVLC